ncbi:MAG: NAD(P)/FAD-dependent oxidoreductase [Actinomycetota bacterium]|nr:NAD(P)/FAD-dependent oxidoreductase [Actinomycetota bacterium]
MGSTANLDHDVVIIGAGVCGIYALHRLLQKELNVTVVEAGSGPGGTWYWNRYPGCRFDSESWSYGYSFSDEILQEWNWSEHFAPQPETLKYLEYVVDKLSLAPHMQFDCKVIRCVWDETSRSWRVDLEDGRSLSTRFLMTAVGLLSAPTMPTIPGVEDFEGDAWHTYYWPKTDVDFRGKRVGVIGTGATGVQLIGALADKVDELVVFQRRPNWCAPLHNSAISTEEMDAIKTRYSEIFEQCRRTPGGFIHEPLRTAVSDVSVNDRHQFWEDLYNSPGFGIWIGNYRDVLIEQTANDEFTAWIANKIRDRVDDPWTAEKLIPTDHGFGTRRVPMETHYYEAYNRDNVRLVCLRDTPIERITPKGVLTTHEDYELDILVYATGFDAVTGSFDRIEFIGTDNQTLRDRWVNDPITYLGVQIHGFPNLFTLAGPTAGSVSTNFPRGIEDGVDWAADLVQHILDHEITRVECTTEAEDQWSQHVQEMYNVLLLSKTESWFNGYNSNVDRDGQVRHLLYWGGAPRYRDRLKVVADNNYEGFVLT